MKAYRLLLALLAGVASAHGAVPDQATGHVYYESTSTIAPGGIRASTSLAIVLNADGKFTGLYYSASSRSSSSPEASSTTTAPADGTYSYSKQDDKTATLTLSLAAPGGHTLRTLTFTADDGGTVGSPGFALLTSGTFRLAPVGSRAPLSNCSNRSLVPASGIAFTGFVVTASPAQPNQRRLVLIRAVGQTLSAFGVTNGLRDPMLNVYVAGTNSPASSNDDWSSPSAEVVSRVGSFVGAFPLPANSKDAALVLELSAGAYIAQTSSSDPADTGQALIEVYLLP